ncbi:MAG: YdjY domain-containing protein [Candidatus Hinthialibacter antarcticus]|nr:YdjY domain-containing protein [Candidatus Hinthialibacter antarcticus]
MIEVSGDKVTFGGKIYPARFNSRNDRANGHHFIVWSGGGNARKALIESNVPDVDILAKLIATGAKPGDNLTAEAWTERKDEKSTAPDQRVEGTKIRITVEWDGVEHRMGEMIESASESDFDIRVGGHAALVPVWRSGCVTCLFSCPGGRTSNHAFTIRDQALDRKTFRAIESNLPKDGAAVRVNFYSSSSK